MSDASVKKAPAFVCLAVFAVSFALSVFFFLKTGAGRRTVFYFPSYDSAALCTEVRYLPQEPVQGSLALFVDELLLGPMTNRYKKVLSSGTRCEFCFVKGDTAYIGLSRDALVVNSEVKSILAGLDVLKVNIVKNFTNIHTVDVFIDGKSVCEEVFLQLSGSGA